MIVIIMNEEKCFIFTKKYVTKKNKKIWKSKKYLVYI